MNRQTILGILFILVGLALLVMVCAPVYVAIKSHQPITEPSFPLLGLALGTALFGAWLLPSSGVGATTVNILTTASPYLPFGRRANSGETTVKPVDPNGPVG